MARDRDKKKEETRTEEQRRRENERERERIQRLVAVTLSGTPRPYYSVHRFAHILGTPPYGIRWKEIDEGERENRRKAQEGKRRPTARREREEGKETRERNTRGNVGECGRRSIHPVIVT